MALFGLLLSACSFGSIVLVRMRRRGARILAWIGLTPALLFIPLGTYLAIAGLSDMQSMAMTQWLERVWPPYGGSKDREPAPAKREAAFTVAIPARKITGEENSRHL
jgi:hypothetical protein